MAGVAHLFPELEVEELVLVGIFVSEMTDEQAQLFAREYRAKRRNRLTMTMLWIPGFLIYFAGFHRFYAGQVGMGLLYLFTGGLCLIGTIVDGFRIKTLVYNRNYELAKSTAGMITGRK